MDGKVAQALVGDDGSEPIMIVTGVIRAGDNQMGPLECPALTQGRPWGHFVSACADAPRTVGATHHGRSDRWLVCRQPQRERPARSAKSQFRPLPAGDRP